jgi:flagellar motor switch/type III secretory pathway protein FliN
VPTIDFNELANGVTAVLNQRASEAQSQQREAERLRTIEAERQAEQSAQTTQRQREELCQRVALLEAEQHSCHERCEMLERQYRDLPNRISAERGRLNALLFNLAELKKGL